jgi:hypothetical protein
MVMNIRLLMITILLVVIVAGLVSGVFANSIQHALTVSTTQAVTTMKASTTAGQAAPNAPKVGVTATATMPMQTPADVVAQDTFQRQDQPLWGVATDGRNWDGDANANPVFSVVGKVGQIANEQGTFNALLGSQANSNVEVLLNASLSNFTGNVNLGVVLRWGDANNWYKALIDGTHISILRRAQGVSTTLGTAPFQAQGGVMYSLRFRAVGAMLFAKVWQSTMPEPTTWMVTTTDPTLTAGQVGVRVVIQAAVIVKVRSFMATTASSMAV